MPRQKKNWDKEWEIPEAEQGLTYDDGFLFSPDTDDPPPIKKLKRDLEREEVESPGRKQGTPGTIP